MEARITHCVVVSNPTEEKESGEENRSWDKEVWLEKEKRWLNEVVEGPESQGNRPPGGMQPPAEANASEAGRLERSICRLLSVRT